MWNDIEVIANRPTSPLIFPEKNRQIPSAPIRRVGYFYRRKIWLKWRNTEEIKTELLQYKTKPKDCDFKHRYVSGVK